MVASPYQRLDFIRFEAELVMNPKVYRSVAMWASAVLMAACLPGHAISAEKKTLAFAVTKWNTAMYESHFMDECPEGLNPSNRDIWWAALTPEQRRRTLRSAGHAALSAANFPRPQRRRRLCEPDVRERSGSAHCSRQDFLRPEP